MSNKTIYNYWCTKGCSTKNIQAQGKRVKCPTCNKVMKELGIATSIVHVGTQESKLR
jgi:hypothetical protein